MFATRACLYNISSVAAELVFASYRTRFIPLRYMRLQLASLLGISTLCARVCVMVGNCPGPEFPRDNTSPFAVRHDPETRTVLLVL